MRGTIVVCVIIALFLLGNMCCMLKVAPGTAGIHIAFYLLVIGILAFVVWSTGKTRFEISEEGLRVRGDMWGRLLQWNELDVTNARIVNFTAEPGLKPKWRTIGTCLPGYSAGWFRLYNKSKALAFLSDKTEAVFIPTRKDFSVLLSSENNPALLQAIQQCGKK